LAQDQKHSSVADDRPPQFTASSEQDESPLTTLKVDVHQTDNTNLISRDEAATNQGEALNWQRVRAT
jgi:hypothetical protein